MFMRLQAGVAVGGRQQPHNILENKGLAKNKIDLQISDESDDSAA